MAKQQVEGSIQFYSQLFEKSCSLNWHQVVEEASKYVEPLEKIAPRHVEEIRGIAKGAGRPFLDILALNVRTEINFGLFTDKAKNVDIPSDGCTSLGWLTQSTSFLAQNWDWQIAQRDNLIVCHISQPGTDIPRISQVTEGGIIGKIGLNSSGVGCLLNAIRCRGVEPTKLPIHFALRTILESGSRKEAIERIERVGVAGSGHILIGDPTGSTGLECTHKWVKELPTNEQGVLCHTNHLLLEHDDVEEPLWLEDSPSRLQRIQDLTSRIRDPTREGVFDLFTDEEGSPASINRKRSEERSVETLFNIVMDLTRKNATVTLGRPTEHAGQILLAF